MLLLVSAVVNSSPVSKERARIVAENFLNSTVNNTASTDPVSLHRMPAISRNAAADCFYIFSSKSGKSVVVAADDCARPVLGFMETPLPAGDMPANLKAWLNGYNREITYAREHGLEPSEEIKEQWNQLSARIGEPKVIVAPLVQTTWDQVYPYNTLTPESTPTGCVATAMAQIMRYWKFPEQGNGSRAYKSNYGRLSADFEHTTYDWDNMPLYITEYSSQNYINAVSTLMYHCGIAASMEYGTDGSGTYVIENYSQRGDDCAEYALKTYFGYKSSMHGELRDYKPEGGRYTDAEWTEMVKAELNAGRPLLYSGYGDEGGHAFVCDGYREDNTFHFNWGWSGYGDGYFALDALVVPYIGEGGGDGHFNYLQHALFGVEPDKIEVITQGRYDLQMGSRLALQKSSIEFLESQEITLSAQVKNCGELGFAGVLQLLLTDSEGNIIDTVYNASHEINSTHRVVVSTTYTTKSLLTPGIYNLVLCYCDSRLQKGEVGHTQYSNVAQWEIYYRTTAVNAVSEYAIGEGGLHTKQNATIGITAKNIDTFPYTGQIRLVLVNADFTDIPQVLTTVQDVSLQPDDTINIVFDGMVTVPVGKYLLALQYYKSGSWSLAGSEEYYNPVWVDVTDMETSVADLTAKVGVYPNPASDVMYISRENADRALLRLTDLSGRTVISDSTDSRNTSINVSGLPPGLYMVIIETDKSREVVKVIIR